MRGSTSDMFRIARLLGECEIATSARNWDTMHSAVVITTALAPAALSAIGERVHHELDRAFRAAQNNPMEAPSPGSICVVTVRGPMLLTLITCIDKILESQQSGEIKVETDKSSAAEHLAFLRGARASFYEYLRSREVGAEVLFEEE